MAKKQGRIFGQISPLVFTDKVSNTGSSNTSRITLPFAENVKNDTKEKKDIQFVTLPQPTVRAGADYKSPTWTKVEWGGLNLRDTIDSGELSYAKNLSTDLYPYLTPRPSRKVYKSDIYNPQALFAIEGALIWIAEQGEMDSTEILYYDDGNSVREYILQTAEDNLNVARSMVDYNGKILIFPDKKYLDYENLPSNGSALPSIPDMNNSGDIINIDYATVHNNRVFGVHGNEIYGNALGKFNNWTQAEQLTTDAWAADVASQGSFTGVTTYEDHVVLFKPDYLHEQWGSVPPFRIKDIFAVGTIENDSVKEVNGVLFFCSKNGVYIYTGGKPKLISLNLNKKYKYARAGTDGRRYYLSVYDGTQWDLFVYDTEFRLWTREDNLEVIQFTYWKDHVYALVYKGNGQGEILRFNSGNETVEWEAVTEYYAGNIMNKYIHEIRLRFEIPTGSDLSIYIQYDNDEFEEVETYDGSTGIQTLKCSIIPKQADRYRIKFTGTGYVKIHAMEVLMSTGGD